MAKDFLSITVGRRKEAAALVKIAAGTGKIIINNRTIKDYIGGRISLERLLMVPLEVTDNTDKFDIFVSVKGGGVSSQCGAIRHGIARGLVELNTEHRAILKPKGLLTRDAREKERKKYGLKRARKAFQFSKR